ncbi:MAG: siderophore-interacting protein [Pseudomonadota bacterium]
MDMHRATLTVPLDEAFEPLAQMAERNGFPVERDGPVKTITAPLGMVEFRRDSTGTAVDFSAPSPAELQLLKDLYADRLAKLGLDVGIVWHSDQGQVPLNQVRCHVASCVNISPNFVRVRLDGAFGAFAAEEAGLHFRFLFGPEPGTWPYLDARGLTTWPGGAEAWHRPPFTVRHLAEDASWMDVDIVLHQGGRVTEWCDRVQPGDPMAIQGPSGTKRPKAPWLGLFGDETAMPIVMRMIESAPADATGQATLALRDPADAQSVPARPDFPIKVVDMADETALLSALEALEVPADLPAGARQVFFAAERAQATQARALYKDKGLSSGEAKAASYWTRS